MGIFERFRKKNEDDKKTYVPTSWDLREPVLKKMIDWIEHPMEFGKKPDEAKIVDERVLFWPTQENEKCYLVEFTINDNYYIGFTGPTTWCFVGIDFKKLTFEQLYERYAGWFIAFFTVQSKEYDKTLEGINEEKVIGQLNQNGLINIQTLQKAFIGGNTYYEFSAEKNGEKIKVVGIEGDFHEYKTDYILPYFEYIGIAWNPLNIE